MAFNSVQYIIFLIVIVVVTRRLQVRARNMFLLLVSYGFYATWDWRFLSLIAISTVLGYTSGIAMGRTTDERRRKSILISRVAMNLVFLGIFKYLGFFVESANGLLESIGLSGTTSVPNIILPVAISYYTFEEIAYAMDVFRRRVEPTRNVVDYALFVAFFPKLVAGPILRPDQLLPQLRMATPKFTVDSVFTSFGLILFGLVKKVVIADQMVPIVSEAFDSPGSASALTLLLGALAFSFQIYGDFSGYSDIARGSSRLLGIELPRNFEQPYLSTSITEFWRTWHISLSTWLRDYLYVPLGGNRRSPRRTMINLFLVMMLGGLWHGAAWTFVAWGALHGVYLGIERAFGVTPRPLQMPRGIVEFGKIIACFGIVSLTWIFFRARSFAQAIDYFQGLVTMRPGSYDRGSVMLVLLAGVIVATSDLLLRRFEDGGASVFLRRPIVFGAAAGAALMLIMASSGARPEPFIYFQF